MHHDLAIYLVHALFWAAFGVTRILVRGSRGPRAAASASGPVAQRAETVPFSRALIAVHMLAFGVLYFGVAQAVLPDAVPDRFPGQRPVGVLLIATGAALMCWSLVYFRSWRFRAQVEAGHELATGGPFRWQRHPIYMGMNLLALGTAAWVPTPTVAVALAVMVIGSDLRARAEEKLLEQTFGDAYRAYRARTRRFIPRLY
jgi:protein-S-isoprenylcysteine O-methyltransferase Ste14